MDKIEAIFYIEGLSNDKKALESAVENIVKELKGENLVEVLEINPEDIMEGEGVLKYSAVIEAKVRGTFEGVVNAVLKYGPAIVEVLAPGKIELDSKSLMKILGDVSLVMGKLMNKFGSLAAYPDLSEVPEPRIGYSREEIESLILDDRYIRYRLVIEVSGKDRASVEETMKKALSLEGCLINVMALEGSEEDGEFKGLLAVELLSNFETLFQLVGKYAPVAISILEPEIIDVTAGELQNTLTDLGGFVNELTSRPVKKALMSNQ
ncbi:MULTISPECIES: hypothetical protein [Thermococcus]|uniref:Uncharacterized protein n=1 Tax=Thermococcus nautili TaxID=195522 RepID=W8PIG7_9EURY|nr:MULTISPECIES: hypothetical protein [Thermococcus]AHL21919.1 hypothetical protein BD01_0292 [Thermococcus nautili]NJE48839.1 hypothetical protein [Thermococcus sp. 9N3]CAI1494042.1 conserved protein of unknown function [Thermococcus nautili]